MKIKASKLTDEHYLLIARAVEAELLGLMVIGDTYYKMPERYKWGMRGLIISGIKSAIENPKSLLKNNDSFAYLNSIVRLEKLASKDKRCKKFRKFYDEQDAKFNKEVATDMAHGNKKEYKSIMKWLTKIKKVGN